MFNRPGKLSVVVLLVLAFCGCKTRNGAGGNNSNAAESGAALIGGGGSGVSRVTHPRTSNPLLWFPSDGASGGFNPASGNYLVQLPGGGVFRGRAGFQSGAFGSGTAAQLVPIIAPNSATVPTTLDLVTVDGNRVTYNKNATTGYFVSKLTNDWIQFSPSPAPSFKLTSQEGTTSIFAQPQPGGQFVLTQILRNGVVEITNIFDAASRLYMVKNSQGTWLYGYQYYDTGNCVKSISDYTRNSTDNPDGYETTFFTYTQSGSHFNLTSVTTPEGTYAISWDTLTVPPTQLDVPNKISKISGTSELVLARYSWNDDGSIAAISDSLNNLTKFTHSATSAKVSSPADQSITYNFIGGRLSSISPKAGETQNFTWYDDGLLSTSRSGKYSTSIGYDTDGNATKITDTAGSVSTVTVNTFRPVTIAMPQPHILATSSIANADSPTALLSNTVYGYGGAAPDVFLTSMYSYGIDQNTPTQSISITPDAAGRPLSITNDGIVTASYTYDATGRVKTYTDANKIQTTYTYDTKNRVTLVETPATGWKQEVKKIDRGRVKSVTNSLGSSSFEFEGISSRVTKAITPLSSAAVLYDAFGRLTGNNSTVTSTGGSNSVAIDFKADNSQVTKKLNGQQTSFNSVLQSGSSGLGCPSGRQICTCLTPGPNGLCCGDAQNVCQGY